MPGCCVFGCKNRHSAASQLKFYRIPGGYRPCQINRRRAWLHAIEEANGSKKGLAGNVRICGAHFVSGEASRNHESPDFVPSVFICAEPSPKKRAKRIYSHNRRSRRKASSQKEEDDSPVDTDTPVLMEIKSEHSEEIHRRLTRSETKGSKTLTKEANVLTHTTPSPKKTSKTPEDTPKQDKIIPIILIKPLILPSGRYQCEQCSENFTSVSQLVKHVRQHEEQTSFICDLCGKLFTNQSDFSEHKSVHTDDSSPHDPCDESSTTNHDLQCHKEERHDEEISFICEDCGKSLASQSDLTAHRCVHSNEPSYPCNMCDRSFDTSHNLKRHKLRHVKDGRKCGKCGVLFCRRHNHILFHPKPESEEDSTIFELEKQVNLMAENGEVLVKSEPIQDDDLDYKTALQTIIPPLTTTAPSPTKSKPLSAVPFTVTHIKFLPKNPFLLLSGPFSVLPPRALAPALAPAPTPALAPAPTPALAPAPTRTPTPTPPPAPQPSANARSSIWSMPPPPNPPAPYKSLPFPPRPPELPTSLDLFSPKYLNSALLEVTRNYEYILSKPVPVRKVIKEEPPKVPPSPAKKSAKSDKKEKTAYDLEIDI